ncbi:MAG: hypothetical protein ACM3PZ_02535 [Bacillota bacterium]
MQTKESVFELDEIIINRIKEIFSKYTEISDARKTMASDPQIKPLYEFYRFKIEEKNKYGKCLITLSRKNGTGSDIPIQTHLHHTERDKEYPSREKYHGG